MQKGWSILFGVVLLACFVSLAISPYMGWWMPQNVASFGGDMDYLFYIILCFTGFFFILTEAPARRGHVALRPRPQPQGRASFTATTVWSCSGPSSPAAILLYIAFAQVPAWARMKSAEATSWFVYGKFKVTANANPDIVHGDGPPVGVAHALQRRSLKGEGDSTGRPTRPVRPARLGRAPGDRRHPRHQRAAHLEGRQDCASTSRRRT